MKRIVIAVPFFFILALSVYVGSGIAADGSTNSIYRQDMRDFVQGISVYAREIHPEFIMIPQNGGELLTVGGEPADSPVVNYISAIDGVGREDLFYGYDHDNTPTRVTDRNYLMAWMELARSQGLAVLVIDYCWAHRNMDNSYQKNHENGYLSFAADDRQLRDIPSYPATPYHMNAKDINTLKDAQNFLVLLNPEKFTSKARYLAALDNTNYDLIIMDLDFDGAPLTAADLAPLKTKQNGGRRLLICYCSIGEAEDYRYYWDPSWATHPPAWLLQVNPNWPGNYLVKYWEPGWQQIIYGNNSSYIKRIIDAGFDGAYLDIIDAFERFENP